MIYVFIMIVAMEMVKIINGWRYFTLTRVNVKTQQSYTLALCVFNA